MKWGKATTFAVVFASLCWLASAGEIVVNYSSQETEPNDTRITAGWLLFGGDSSPSFWMDADVDYYRLMITTLPTTLTVSVVGVPGNDPAARIEDESGGTIAVPAVFIEQVFVTTGTYYVAVFHQDRPNFNPAATSYTLSGQFSQRDDEPPTYTATIGIQRVERGGDDSVSVEWSPAVDNFTPAENIIYNVYWKTSRQDLFTPPAGASYAGITSAVIPSGIDPEESYYFGVRARDLVGNEEENEVAIFVPVRLAVNPATWLLYR